MKRVLATALAFITLAAAALVTPVATASGNIETTLMFILNYDGSSEEVTAVYSKDNTINSSNCKNTKTYTAEFNQSDGKNECVFRKHYDRDENGPAWSTHRVDDKLEFNFMSLSVSMRIEVADALGLKKTNDLNVVYTVAALPLNATVTRETLSPKVAKGSKNIYYTWNGNTAVDSTAELKGTIPFSSTTVSPSIAPAPEGNGLNSDNPSGNNTTVLAVSHKPSDSNTALYVVLGVVSVVALTSVVTTVLLVQKRKEPSPTVYFAASTRVYNGQPHSGPHPQQASHPFPQTPEPQPHTSSQSSLQHHQGGH